jgi:hypothetical protein
MIRLLPFLSKIFLSKMQSDTRVWLGTAYEPVPGNRPFQRLRVTSEDTKHLDDGIGLTSGRVAGEDKVASLDRLVAGEASLEQNLVGRFAVFELSKSPTARRGVFS